MTLSQLMKLHNSPKNTDMKKHYLIVFTLSLLSLQQLVAQNNITHHYADVNGIKMHYAKAGKGDPIIILHGFPADWFEWRHVMTALEKKYTVIVPDLRGIGETQKVKKGYELENQAKDVASLIDVLGYDTVNLVGHDIGAPIAYATTELYPEKVTKVALLEFIMAGAGMEEVRKIAAPNLWFFDFQTQPELGQQLLEGKMDRYIPLFFRPYTYNPLAITDEALDHYIEAYSKEGAIESSFQHYVMQLQYAEKAKELMKTKLEVPVLALAGEFSLGNPKLGSPAEKSIKKLTNNVTYKTLKDCGHWIAEEQPEELSNELSNFFK